MLTVTVIMPRKIRCRAQAGRAPVILPCMIILGMPSWTAVTGSGELVGSYLVSGCKQTHSYSEHQIFNSSLLIFLLRQRCLTFPLRLADRICLEGYVLSGFHGCVLHRNRLYVVEQSHWCVVFTCIFEVLFEQVMLLSSIVYV